MRYAWLMLGLLACAGCNSKNSAAKSASPGVAAEAPGALSRPPSSDRLPGDLRPPREE